MLIEKVGPVWLVTQQGAKTPVANVPAVLHQGQGGMLAFSCRRTYATDQSVYHTFDELRRQLEGAGFKDSSRTDNRAPGSLKVS